MSGDLKPEIDLLRNWIQENSPKPVSVDDDDELIESQILDSFAFIQFVYYLEEVFGREIVLDESIASNFSTLTTICRHFKGGAIPAGARHG